MTEIYLVRHAEAEGNAYRRIHGQYDSRLTENGLRQVAALEVRFAGAPIDACYASDLNRTCMTARAVYVPKGIPLRRDARFREVNLGRWEDTPFGWLERTEHEAMERFNHEPESWSVEGSETFPVYTARFLTALHEAAAENAGKTIAVFSHGCVLRGVQHLLLEGQWPGYCDNTAVSHLYWDDGRLTIDYLNDASHLCEEISTFARQKWWRQGGDRRDFNMWFTLRDGTFYAMLREQEVGQVRFSTDGTIQTLCMYDGYRGRHFGQQLLGCAVSRCRAAGAQTLRITLAKDAREITFYRRCGFVPVSTADASVTLEKDIRVPQD